MALFSFSFPSWARDFKLPHSYRKYHLFYSFLAEGGNSVRVIRYSNIANVLIPASWLLLPIYIQDKSKGMSQKENR